MCRHRPARGSSARAAAIVLTGVLAAGCAGPPRPASGARASGGGYPVTVTGCGHSSKITARPRRAVTLNQGATEIALSLGVSGRLAGTAYLDDAIPAKWRAAYKKVPVLSKEYPSREKLLAIKPDFVYGTFASAFEGSAAGSQASLAKVGIPSYLSPFGCAKGKPRGAVEWPTVWSEISTAGRAFGVPDRAARVTGGQEATVTSLRKKAAGRGLTAFWYDSGDKTPYAGAGQGGPQLIMNTVGLTNVFAGLKGGWADASWEKVVKADPDVIILADAGFSPAAEKKKLLRADPALRKLDAVRHNRFVVLPFSQSTPGVTLIDGAATVSGQLARSNPPA